MKQFKSFLKKIPGVMFAVNKTRDIFWLYDYHQALLRIKNTKEIIIQRHANDPGRKISVAFIIQYVPSWNKLKPVYDKLMNNKDFKVLLLCVPSWLNESRLENKNCKVNDTFLFFKENGYACVDAFKGNHWFNLVKFQPDYVFHSRPYNHFMPEPYTSSTIAQYALICNVMYGAALTRGGREILLNQDYFKDVYCYFAFERYEKDYYDKKFYTGISKGIQKCYPYGATGLEQILAAKSERKNNGFKKTVIWAPRWSTEDGSTFFRYKDVMESLIKKYTDILFIIRPHPLMFGNFLKTGEMTEQDIADFRKFCNDSLNVELDEKKEYNKTFWQSDFIISDASAIVPEYYVTDKPIIYCLSVPDSTHIEHAYSEYMQRMLGHSYVVINQKEFMEVFELLCADDDFKKNNRQKCLSEIFGNINELSLKIVETLKSEIRQKET